MYRGKLPVKEFRNVHIAITLLVHEPTVCPNKYVEQYPEESGGEFATNITVWKVHPPPYKGHKFKYCLKLQILYPV